MALHDAARRGDLLAVQALLRTHAHECHMEDHRGLTPLHIAAHRGDAEIVCILAHYTDPESARSSERGLTPLHLACVKGHAAVVPFLKYHSYPDHEGNLPHHDACAHGHVAVVRALWEWLPDGFRCFNEHAHAPLYLAARGDHVEVVKAFPPDDVQLECQESGNVAHAAAQHGSMAVLRYLTETHPDLFEEEDVHGHTPLDRACMYEHAEATRFLGRLFPSAESMHAAVYFSAIDSARALAEVLPAEYGLVMDGGDDTPLHRAAGMEFPELVQILVSWQPAAVHVAKSQGDRSKVLPHHLVRDVQSLKHLVAAGADLDAKDGNNMTILHMACAAGSEELVDYILGVRPTLAYIHPRALHWARLKGTGRKLLHLFVKHGINFWWVGAPKNAPGLAPHVFRRSPHPHRGEMFRCMPRSERERLRACMLSLSRFLPTELVHEVISRAVM